MPRLASGPYLRARRPRPFEKNALDAIPGPSPAKPPPLGSSPAERRAPHARKNVITLTRISPPSGPPGCRQLVRNHAMPRFAPRLPPRTRRARPSEKTASRVVPGLSPPGCPCKARPRLGGAGSARPQCRHRGLPRHVPTRQPGVRSPPIVMLCPGSRTALPHGRGDPRPLEKITFRVISGRSPLGDPRCPLPLAQLPRVSLSDRPIKFSLTSDYCIAFQPMWANSRSERILLSLALAPVCV